MTHKLSPNGDAHTHLQIKGLYALSSKLSCFYDDLRVLSRILTPQELDNGQAKPESAFRRLFRMVGKNAKAGVKVSGEGDMLVRFGRCCDPLPGERILGFITRGRGVTVHAVDCPHVLQTDPQRRIEVAWDDEPSAPRSVPVEVLLLLLSVMVYVKLSTPVKFAAG